MEHKFAEKFFPKNLGRVERRRTDALSRPLNGDQIAILLSMRFNRKPLYVSIEEFYSPEYRSALESGTAPAELSEVVRYRCPTPKEVNMLFSDIHAKEKVYEATGGQPAQ